MMRAVHTLTVVTLLATACGSSNERNEPQANAAPASGPGDAARQPAPAAAAPVPAPDAIELLGEIAARMPDDVYNALAIAHDPPVEPARRDRAVEAVNAVAYELLPHLPLPDETVLSVLAFDFTSGFGRSSRQPPLGVSWTDQLRYIGPDVGVMGRAKHALPDGGCVEDHEPLRVVRGVRVHGPAGTFLNTVCHDGFVIHTTNVYDDTLVDRIADGQLGASPAAALLAEQPWFEQTWMIAVWSSDADTSGYGIAASSVAMSYFDRAHELVVDVRLKPRPDRDVEASVRDAHRRLTGAARALADRSSIGRDGDWITIEYRLDAAAAEALWAQVPEGVAGANVVAVRRKARGAPAEL